jgi:ABC-type sugar transport system permease subunit/ABC-type glycerol-3-phosphate transport system substrate-binding protein
MPHRIRLIPLLVAAVMGIAAFGFAQTQTKKSDLVIWGINLGPESKGAEAVIREFERRNPDIRVKVLSMGAGSMDPQKLMTSIVGNVAPDVINQDRFTISDWASRGAFLPLDDLIKRDLKTDPNTPRKEDYYPAPWSEATYNGKVYAIPTGADNRILYYNKSIFKSKATELRAAGLDPDRPPRTWSELLAYSKVLTDIDPKTGELKVAGFMPNFGNSWLYIYSFENNGRFMTPDGRRCTMGEQANVEALDFMVKGYELVGGYERAKAFESGFLGKENDAFIIGKVAMKIDGDWILDGLSRYAPALDFGVGPPPVPDDRYYRRGKFKDEKETFVTWFGGFSLAIPEGARHVENGWKYVKWATSTEARLLEMRAQAEFDRGRGRVYIPRQIASRVANVAGFEEFRPKDKKFADALEMHVSLGSHGKVRPATFVGQILWNEHVRALEAACYKKLSPQEALSQGQANVQRELDAFYDQAQYPVINLAMPQNIGIGLMLLGVIGAIIWFARLKMGAIARHEAICAYVFISPWIIGFLLWILGPMLASLFFSFTQYDVLGDARWVGLKNYHDMATVDRQMALKALGNAAYLAAFGVPLGLATGLAVALLLNVATRGMRFYRTFFYMPAIVPGVASAVLWTWVLTPDANKGLINSFWQRTLTPWLSLPPPAWLQSADWSKNALILMGLWGAGSGMVLWLAGIKGVPSSLYEAASIDGATPKQQFWSVTFPQLSPIIFFNMVMGFIGAMQEFDRMYIMKPASDGSVGPDDSMLTPVFHLFQNGFAFFKMGYASALAWAIFLIILALTGAQWALSSKWVHYEGDK